MAQFAGVASLNTFAVVSADSVGIVTVPLEAGAEPSTDREMLSALMVSSILATVPLVGIDAATLIFAVSLPAATTLAWQAVPFA